MAWFWRERRGAAWKLGWAERTLGSISLPPLPLLALFLIIFLLLSVSSYISYRNQVQHTLINFKLFLLFLPVILIFIAQFISTRERFFFFPNTKAQYGSVPRKWDLPWGVVMLVVVLLVMVSYHSSCQSMWSPIVWRTNW